MPIFSSIDIGTLLEITGFRGRASSSDSDSSLHGDPVGASMEEEEEENNIEAAAPPNKSLLSVQLRDKCEEDDFFDSCDLMSDVNSMDEVGTQTASSYTSHCKVYSDTDEDLFSDESVSNISSPHLPQIEVEELGATRFSLIEEIERRKAAEKALDHMYCQWQRISSALSEANLTFPTPLHQNDSTEQLLQEIFVARFVSEAIGKGLARAEAEIDAAAIIESKNQEISQLRNRMQYYETANYEMCHRNQVMGFCNLKSTNPDSKLPISCERKNSQRKWIWGCIGLSIAVGSSVIANSYFPMTSKYLVGMPTVFSGASTSTSSEPS